MSDPVEGARRQVKAEQAQLLRALVGCQTAPLGFDPDRVKVQATALRKKRSRLVAASAQDLVATLDADWDRLFDLYAQEHPLESGRRRSDTAGFRRWLRREGRRQNPGTRSQQS